jgi:hypothetical protein
LSEPDGHLISSTRVLVQEPASIVGPSGCPLSRFIPKEEIPEPQIQTPEIKNSDLEGSKGNISIPQENISTMELDGKDHTSIGPVREIIRNQPTIKHMTTYDPYMERDPSTDFDLVEPDIYADPNADYDRRYDEDPNNSLLRKELTNYEPEPERRIQTTTTRRARQLQGFREIEREENTRLVSVSGWSTIAKQIATSS